MPGCGARDYSRVSRSFNEIWMTALPGTTDTCGPTTREPPTGTRQGCCGFPRLPLPAGGDVTGNSQLRRPVENATRSGAQCAKNAPGPVDIGKELFYLSPAIPTLRKVNPLRQADAYQ